MNSEKAAVLVDSGCDIAQECIDKYGLWLLPLHIDYPEKAYLDGVDIDPQMVYNRYPKDYPKTSTPSLQEVLDKRHDVYEAAKARHPERWNGRTTRNWENITEVYLNPDRKYEETPVPSVNSLEAAAS